VAVPTAFPEAGGFGLLAPLAGLPVGAGAAAATFPNSSRMMSIGFRQSGQATGLLVIWSSRIFRLAAQWGQWNVMAGIDRTPRPHW
jgi:hypothetical protein